MIAGEVQKAIFAALDGAAVADGRIYDQPPRGAQFPYVTIGDEQVIDAGTSCGDAWEVYCDIHVWSRPNGGSKLEVKLLRKDVTTAVLSISTIEGFVLDGVYHDTSRSRRDPDGLTEHDISTFRFLVSSL